MMPTASSIAAVSALTCALGGLYAMGISACINSHAFAPSCEMTCAPRTIVTA
jgi:hypothetical protein